MTLVYSKRAVDLANPFLTKNCFYLLIKLGWLDYTCYITCETLIQQKDDSKSLHILDLRLFDIQTSCHQSYPVKLFILETIWWGCAVWGVQMQLEPMWVDRLVRVCKPGVFLATLFFIRIYFLFLTGILTDFILEIF